ncbi:MAG: hypothetical protein U0R71_05790 [Solirubrobacterales bacterium]
MSADYLAIMLNDHLAGATAGVELARRTSASNRDEPEFGPPLEELQGEIEADRATLEQVMAAAGAGRDQLKLAAGWVAEKLGRLKPNGQLRGYSPLSRVVELEGLVLGITGKLRLWSLLAEREDQALRGFDFAALAERATEQRRTAERLQSAAAGRL